MGKDDSIIKKQEVEAKIASLEQEEIEVRNKRRRIDEEQRRIDEEQRKIDDAKAKLNRELDVIKQVLKEKSKFQENLMELRQGQTHGFELVDQVQALRLKAEQ